MYKGVHACPQLCAHNEKSNCIHLEKVSGFHSYVTITFFVFGLAHRFAQIVRIHQLPMTGINSQSATAETCLNSDNYVSINKKNNK